MKSEQFITPLVVNQDADERVLKPTECRDALNLRSGTVDGSNAPWRENVKGTTEIPNPYYHSGDILIHSVEDIQNDAVILFIYNKRQEYNKILRWFPSTNVIERILQNKYLNFQKNHPISADVVNGLLYWTDGYFNSFISSDFNPPRKINIAKAKKFSDKYYDGNTCAKFSHVTRWSSDGVNFYTKFRLLGNICPFVTGKKVVCWTEDGDTYGFRHKWSTGYCTIQSVTVVGLYAEVYTTLPWGGGSTPQARSGHILAYDTDMYFGIDWQTLDRVKYKPQTDMSVSYDNDTTQKINKLRNNLYQFCYRYIYDDNEKTVWSKPSDIALPTVYHQINGSYVDASPIDNVINVWVDSGPLEVKTIEIAARVGNTGDWRLVERKEKYDDTGNVLINSDIFILYPFYNFDLGEALLQQDVSRPFDYVPQVSGVETLIEKNRLLDANYTEGYDNVKIDVALTSRQENINLMTSVTDVTPPVISSDLTLGWGRTDDWGISGWGSAVKNYDFYVPGYDYLICLNGSPFKYGYRTPYTYTADQSFPKFFDKTIFGFAFVSSTATMTWEEFSNRVCSQFQRGNDSNDAGVIMLNNYDYKYWADVDYVRLSNTGGAHWPGDNSLGWITESLLLYEDPIVRPKIQLTIYRITPGTYTNDVGFKSGAMHPFCINYYDRAGRMGGANATTDSQVYVKMPNELTSGNVQKNVIDWEINHTPPDWAAYYRWGYAGNSTESYFLQAIITDIGPADINNYVYFDVNQAVVDMRGHSTKFNVPPYEWKRGDRVRFLYNKKGTTYTAIPTILDFEILGIMAPSQDRYLKDIEGDFVVDADGNKVQDTRTQGFVVDDFDYESYGIERGNTVVEVYRPTLTREVLGYKEFGKTYPILNAHTASRTHGGDTNQTALLPATGTFNTGDVYHFARFGFDVFPCESAWYSDYFDSEVVGTGAINTTNRNMRRQQFISNIRWSGMKIENTLVNELSRNDAGDVDTLAERFEDIYSIREDGYTLKILQKNKPTSIYVGKAGLKQADIGGQDLVTITDNVLGSKAVWGNDYGTIFPASVAGSYFYDIYNGCIIRWADNGMVKISDYGMKKYFRDKSKALLASGIQNVHVYATFEKEFGNYIISFVDDLTPANNATWAFSESDNAWITRLSFTPSWLGSCGSYMFSSPPTGKIYQHNVNSVRNNFYGIQYNSEITLASNDQPNMNKVFNAIAVHSNKKWGAPATGDVLINSNGTVMQSRLKEAQFQTREGIHTAAFLRDMYSSGIERLDDLHNGRVLRGESIRIKLTNTDTDEAVLFGVNVKSTISE